jgi:GxxExxY protein
MATKLLHSQLSHRVIGLCFKVHSGLGCALPERLYSRAMHRELESAGIPHTVEEVHKVYYAGEELGIFRSDIIVDRSIILEFKSVDVITPAYESQILTYMSVTRIQVGLIVNFGVRSLQFRRLVRTRKQPTIDTVSELIHREPG